MMGFWDGSGISWTICKQSAPRSRQITTPTLHHSIFTGRMLFLTPNQQCQSTKGTVPLRVSEYSQVPRRFFRLAINLVLDALFGLAEERLDNSRLELRMFRTVFLHVRLYQQHTHTHARLTALFRDYPGEPLPER